jgi:hypothetical protein
MLGKSKNTANAVYFNKAGKSCGFQNFGRGGRGLGLVLRNWNVSRNND